MNKFHPISTDNVLKTINPYFTLIWNNRKTSELRKLDQDSRVGQIWSLIEYFPVVTQPYYGNRAIIIEITRILTFEEFPEAIQPGYGVLSFRKIGNLILDTTV